mgnify:CR=1 FL=1
MNWGIYEKRKKTIIWAFALNVIIVLIVVILPALGTTRCIDYPFTKDKSRLKQIGTTVAMYFTENINRDTFYKILEIQLANYNNIDLSFTFNGSGMCKIIKVNKNQLNLPKLIKARKYYVKNLLKKFILLFKKV